MSILKQVRTKETFLEKIQTLSPLTQDSIRFTITNFENYSMKKFGQANIIPDLQEAKEQEIFDVLQHWINWNSDKAPSSVKTYWSHLRKYLHYFGIKLNPLDIKSELDFKHKVEEDRYGLNRTDIQKILANMRYKHRVQYMCQLSSCMRIGEIIQLRKKHLILGGDNIIVKIPPTIAKFSKGRTTFFSKESSKLLYPILKELQNEDLVFGTSENKENSSSSTKQVLRHAVKCSGLDDRYESTNRHTINTHSFRAYGITKLSRHDPNFAKKISGQKGYLLQYDRMDDDEKLELYQKFEFDLIVDETEAKNEEIKRLREEKRNYEEQEEQRRVELKDQLRLEILADLKKNRPFLSIKDELENNLNLRERAQRKLAFNF